MTYLIVLCSSLSILLPFSLLTEVTVPWICFLALFHSTYIEHLLRAADFYRWGDTAVNKIPALMVFTLQSVEISKLVKCVYDLTTNVCFPKQYIVWFCMFSKLYVIILYCDYATCFFSLTLYLEIIANAIFKYLLRFIDIDIFV